MSEKNIDISESLHAQKQQYIKLREDAARLSELWGDSQMGVAMKEQCKIIDRAIANSDQALQSYENE